MHKQSLTERMSRWARKTTDALGSPAAVCAAVLLMAGWLAWGLAVRFNSACQLALNSVTSVIQFPIFFLLLYIQNKDNRASQLKQDELIRAQEAADNRYRHLEAAPDALVAELVQAVEKETCPCE